MCILFLAVHAHPVYPLLFCSNRDEFVARSTQSVGLGLFEENRSILAGKDLRSGGTWAAVDTATGRYAVVLNVRLPEGGESPPAEACSRGELPLLWHNSPPGTSPAGFLRATLLSRKYAGCSLVVADLARSMSGGLNARVFFGTNSSGQRQGHVRVQSLCQSGLYALSNDGIVNRLGVGPLTWMKCRRGLGIFDKVVNSTPMERGTALASTLLTTLLQNQEAIDGLNTEDHDPRNNKIFLPWEPYATLSSAVAMFSRSCALHYAVREFSPADPPATTHFEYELIGVNQCGNAKIVHLLNHGESIAEAAKFEAKVEMLGNRPSSCNARIDVEEAYLDAGLSGLGREQASGVDRVAFGAVELVVASPLSCAVETAALALPRASGYPRPIICLDELYEYARPGRDAQRRVQSTFTEHLETEVGLDADEVDTAFLRKEDDSTWPANPDYFKRADRALAWLVSRPERVIVVAGHDNFMRNCLLSQRNPSVVGGHDISLNAFAHAEVRSVKLSKVGDQYHVCPLPR